MILKYFGFAFSVLLFLTSLLTVFPAPTNFLWKLSILLQEAGHFLILPCLILALLTRSMASPLFVLAALLFASPLLRAVYSSYKLDSTFQSSFGQGNLVSRKFLRTSLLDWKQLAFGIPLPAVMPKTLYYLETEQEKLELDFYPPLKAKSPCILVIHGGGWDSGTRQDLEPLNRYLVQMGYAVAAVDYRLAPKYQYPAPVLDLKAAIAFLERKADSLGLDMEQTVLLGRSAGGQIALQLAYDPSMVGKIKGVIAYYAPADMVFGYHLPTNPWVLDSRKIMENYLGGSYVEVSDKYHISSPIENVRAHSPATLLLHGHADVLVAFEHSIRMQTKLKALGIPHYLVDLPWATHGFDFVFSGPGSQLSLYFMERFLAQVTKTSRKDSDFTGLVK